MNNLRLVLLAGAVKAVAQEIIWSTMPEKAGQRRIFLGGSMFDFDLEDFGPEENQERWGESDINRFFLKRVVLDRDLFLKLNQLIPKELQESSWRVLDELQKDVESVIGSAQEASTEVPRV